MKKNVLKALSVAALALVSAENVFGGNERPNPDGIASSSIKNGVKRLLAALDASPKNYDRSVFYGQINAILESKSKKGGIAKRRALDALLLQIQDAIDAENARIAAAAAVPVSPAPQPAAPAAPQVQIPAPVPVSQPAPAAAAAAAAAAHEEQELARQRQEAEVNDLAGSILDMIEGLPGEKEIWINALEKILSISDLNRKIEALTDLKLKLEIFIATAAANSNRISHSCDSVPDTPPHIPLPEPADEECAAAAVFEEDQQRQQEVVQAACRLAEMKARLMHAAAQVRQEQQRLLRAAAAAADLYDFDSVDSVPNTPLHFLLNIPTDDASCENLRMMKNGTAALE